MKLEIKKEWQLNSKVNENEYNSLYEKSINTNDEFWFEQGKRIDWIKNYTKVKKVKYSIILVKHTIILVKLSTIMIYLW